MLPLFKTFQPNPLIALSSEEFDPAIHEATYKVNYPKLFEHLEKNPSEARNILREIVRQDLFFVVYFIGNWELGVNTGNKPFVVNKCRMVEDGPQTATLDVWARGHMKSTAITVGRTVQRILNNPECTTAIFSFRAKAAEKFVDSIRKMLQMDFMIWLYPDILYEKPETQSPSWSLQGGIRVKRINQVRREHTVEGYGLMEGMPTGGHFDHRIYDDVETMDMASNPDQMDLCFEKIEMSRNLGMEGGTEQIIGTYYSHCGALVKLSEKKTIHGELAYKLRCIPATHDGTADGKPVFVSQEYLDTLKMDRTFNSQQLCNPTPLGDILLDSKMLIPIDQADLWKNRFKFMIIDQAGDKSLNKTKGDLWAIGIVSIDPTNGVRDGGKVEDDDLGISNVCLEDLIADQMTHSEAIETIVRMYLKHGMVMQLGVEKVALSTTEIHICDALKAKGRKLSTNHGNLVLLMPAGRSTELRVSSALQWPLNNGKLHYSTSIAPKYRDQMIKEMDNFPAYHADILNMWAYAYDMFKGFRFSRYQNNVKPRSVTEIMSQGGPIRGDF